METTGTFTINLPDPVSGKTLYVSPTGSDSNTGQKDAPFLTHRRAFEAAQEGDKVVSQEGIYVERTPLRLKSGQSWEVKGKQFSLINDEAFVASHDLERYAVIGENVEGIRLHGIKINNERNASGILIKDAKNISITDLSTQKGSFTGVWIMRSRNIKAEGFGIKNSAWGDDNWQAANLLLTECEDLDFIGFSIEDFGEETWGYGAKTYQWEGKPNYLKNCRFITGNFRGHGEGRFSPANQVPNFAIELFEAQLEGVQILNCNLQQMLSLSSSINESEETGVYVEDTIIAPKFGEAVELSASNVRFKNCQLVSNRMATLVNFKKYLVENINIEGCTLISGNTPYKNAFLYTEGDMKNIQMTRNQLVSINPHPVSVLQSAGGVVDGFDFVNNTFSRKEDENKPLDDHFAMLETKDGLVSDLQHVRYLANEMPDGFNKVYRGDSSDIDSLEFASI